MASTSLSMSITVQYSNLYRKPMCVFQQKSSRTNFNMAYQSPARSSVITFSRPRRNNNNSPIMSKKVKTKKVKQQNVEETDDVDDDAFEALFRQLEEDLKNDGLSLNEGGDGDLNEEEIAELERELAEALGDDELLGALGSAFAEENENEAEGDDEDVRDEVEDEDEDEDEEKEEERPLKLKNWQRRRLAHALRNGRRKTSIKNLAADLCLDRAVVLKLLRDPPPELIMMSATLPDEPVSATLDPVEKSIKTIPVETNTDAAEPDDKEKVPVHVMQSNWAARKRLKKVQVKTLEEVYKRTKRPTNAMISSIVHVTNLPRKRVVKWFEEKRTEEGVPDNRVPYQRSSSETVFTS